MPFSPEDNPPSEIPAVKAAMEALVFPVAQKPPNWETTMPALMRTKVAGFSPVYLSDFLPDGLRPPTNVRGTESHASGAKKPETKQSATGMFT